VEHQVDDVAGVDLDGALVVKLENRFFSSPQMLRTNAVK